MEKAIFFCGCGTSYAAGNARNKSLEIFPETLPALRFLGRRGYLLVLVTPEFQDYKLFQTGLKDKSLKLEYWNGVAEDLESVLEEKAINLQESYFLTDGTFLQELLHLGWKTILVLTGKGIYTLHNLTVCQVEEMDDICKDIYAAAISIAIKK
jgi:hypothetical protein